MIAGNRSGNLEVGMGGLGTSMPAGWEVGLRAGVFTLLASTPVLMIYGHFNGYGLNHIHPLTNGNLDLKRGRRCIAIGVAVGALFWFWYGPARGSTFGTVSGAVLFAYACLQKSGFDVPSQPNQGIVRSKWNAARWPSIRQATICSWRVSWAHQRACRV